MAQQFIDFGTFPNDPSADPIRAAFQKIQNNFVDLYNTTLSTGVTSVEVGPGLGATSNVGNILLTSSFPNITINTSNSLLIGVGAATSNTATVNSYNTPFVINLANTITTPNANITNLVRANNLTVTSFVNSALVPNANVTYDLGTPTNRWKDLYLSGTTLVLGPQTISANASTVTFSSVTVTSNITVNNMSITSNISVSNISSSGNIVVTSNATVGNLTTSGVVTATGNITGGNLITGGLINSTGNITGGNLVTGGVVNSTGTITGGNLATAGTITATGNATVGNLSTTIVTVTGNGSFGNISATGAITATGLGTFGNISTGNITITGNIEANGNLTGNIVANNFSISGFVTGDFLPSAQETYDLGSPSNRWRDLYLSGNSLRLGTSTITSNSSGIVIPNAVISGNLAVGNISAVAVSGQLTTANQPGITSLGLLSNLSVAGNLSTGELSVVGNLQTANLAATSIVIGTGNNQTTITGNGIQTSGNATLQAPGANTEILFNDNGNATAVAGLTFNKNTNLLSISGNVAGGNIISSGGVSASTATLGSIGANTLSANGNVSAGNLITVGILATSVGINSGVNLPIISMSGLLNKVTVTFDAQPTAPFQAGSSIVIQDAVPTDYNGTWTVFDGNTTQIRFNSGLTSTVTALGRILGGGNIATSGFLSVAGNASMGNITTTTLSGAVVTVSGNISGANLVASGILVVDGNANVGNLTTSGLISAATLAATDANVTGNLSAGNLSASGTLSGANLSTSGQLSVTGNASVGNVSTASILMNGNLTGAALMESGLLNVTGNMTGGNVLTNGFLSVTGNATVGNVIANNNLVIQKSANVATNVTVGANVEITNITGSTGVITATFAPQDTVPFPIGATVIISNCAPSGFNGSYTVSTGNTTQITFAGGQSGTAGVNGRIVTGGLGLRVTGNASMSNMEVIGLINASTGSANIGTVNSNVLSVVGTATAGNLSTGGTLSVTGNASAGNFETGLLSTTGNLTVSANANITASMSVGTNLTVGGTANILTLEAASFQSNTANANTINIPTGGILSMATANANIGNIAAGILTANGNVSGANLIASGYLAVTGNASANRITVATGVTTGSHNIGGALAVGTNVAIQVIGSSSNGTVAVLQFSSAQVDAPFPTGQSIVVSNLVPTNLNGTFVVLTSNTTHVTYSSSVNGPVTQGGFVRSSGTGMILQSTANVGGLNIINGGGIDAGSGNVSGGTFSATLFSGNGASITGINMLNTGISVVVTATAGTGAVATLSFASQSYAPFTIGQTITVAGLTPVGYNGSYTVVSCNTTTVTYASVTTGSMTVAGTISGGPKAAAALQADTIISSSQPNITSIGTLTGLTLSGGLTGTDITASGYVLASVGNGISAAGTTQGTATGLTKQVNVISSVNVTTAQGVRLQSATVGMQIIIVNTTPSPVKVYPANAAQIDGLGTNTSFSLGAGARLMVVASSTTQWYTMVGVYG